MTRALWWAFSARSNPSPVAWAMRLRAALLAASCAALAAAQTNATNGTAPNATAYDRCEPNEESQTKLAGDSKYVGIALSALSCFISTAALLVMKLSADVEKGLPLRKRWRWWVGFLANTASEVGLTTVALTFAPLSVIAPVGGLAIVFSALMARFGCVPGVKESLSWAEWASLVLTLAGVVLIAIFGPRTENELPYEAVQRQFARPGYLAYTLLVFVGVFSWMMVLTNKRCVPYRPAFDSMRVSVCSSFFSAISGSYSLQFSKIFTTALIDKIISKGEWSVFTLWITWIAVLGLVMTAVTQLYLLNSALASGKAVFTIPLYTVLIITLAIFNGGILFDEFACLETYQWIVCTVALAILVVGVAVLSHAQEARTAQVPVAELTSPSDVRIATTDSGARANGALDSDSASSAASRDGSPQKPASRKSPRKSPRPDGNHPYTAQVA